MAKDDVMQSPIDYRALCAEALNMLDAYDNGERVFWETWKARARAALAQPEPAEGEVAELVAWLRDRAAGNERFGAPTASAQLTRAADLLEQRHPAPVPVAERLPGPEDCDAEGRCWWLTSECEGQFSWELLPNNELRWSWSHWLPFNALPLPAGEVE